MTSLDTKALLDEIRDIRVEIAEEPSYVQIQDAIIRLGGIIWTLVDEIQRQNQVIAGLTEPTLPRVLRGPPKDTGDIQC